MNLLPIDALNELSMKLREAEYTDKDGKRKSRYTEEEVEDFIEDFLIYTFVCGQTAANDDLGTDVTLSTETLENVLNERVGEDNKNWRRRVQQHYSKGESAETIITVADSEMVRVYNKSGIEAAKKTGKTILKKWQTMEDPRVRISHDLLNGTEIPIDDYFVSVGGDSALYPGGFLTAEQNANCRCFLTYKAV